jgi:hypothetical protein
VRVKEIAQKDAPSLSTTQPSPPPGAKKQ